MGDDQGVTVNCEDEGQKWAKGQVTAALLWRGLWGLQILAAAFGAWLVGVALFGWWKPWWPSRPEQLSASSVHTDEPDE